VQRFCFSFSAMACPCEVQCWASNAAQAQRWFDCARAEVQRIEQKYSRYLDTSVLSQINRNAGHSPIEVDDETAHLLNYAQTCFQASDGAFDITCGALRRVWDFRSATPHLPSPTEIDLVLERIGWQRLTWRPPLLTLAHAMEIDLGGVAKEYAADRAAVLCAQAGASSLLVNLGGDIRALGPQPGGQPWRIGIAHPRAQAQTTVATLKLSQGGIASSGDYERFIEVDGKRYCHILDARTGLPAPECPQSVSVIAPACMLAGSHSTIAMLQGNDAQAWLEATGLSYLLITANGEVHRK
jgi:thiamine biosynthesis lipoprotein